jgi:hypothetical protein
VDQIVGNGTIVPNMTIRKCGNSGMVEHCGFYDSGWRYEMLGISWLISYQPIENLPVSGALGLPIKPQYFIPRISHRFLFFQILFNKF